MTLPRPCFQSQELSVRFSRGQPDCPSLFPDGAPHHISWPSLAAACPGTSPSPVHPAPSVQDQPAPEETPLGSGAGTAEDGRGVTFLPLPPRCALAPLSAEWQPGEREEMPKSNLWEAFSFAVPFLCLHQLPRKGPGGRNPIYSAATRGSCAKDGGAGLIAGSAGSPQPGSTSGTSAHRPPAPSTSPGRAVRVAAPLRRRSGLTGCFVACLLFLISPSAPRYFFTLFAPLKILTEFFPLFGATALTFSLHHLSLDVPFCRLSLFSCSPPSAPGES